MPWLSFFKKGFLQFQRRGGEGGGVTLTGQVWIYPAWWQGKFQLHLLKLTLSKDEYLYRPDEVAQDSALLGTGDLPVKKTS